VVNANILTEESKDKSTPIIPHQ